MSDPQSAVSDPRPSMLAVPIPKPKLPKHLENEETVTMLFPRKLSLNLDDYAGRVDFDEGLQEVPISLADYKGTGVPHWYLKQQGVKRYVKPLEPSDKELVEKLESKGYQVAKLPPEEVPVDSAPAPDRGKVAAPKSRKRG